MTDIDKIIDILLTNLDEEKPIRLPNSPIGFTIGKSLVDRFVLNNDSMGADFILSQDLDAILDDYDY